MPMQSEWSKTTICSIKNTDQLVWKGERKEGPRRHRTENRNLEFRREANYEVLNKIGIKCWKQIDQTNVASVIYVFAAQRIAESVILHLSSHPIYFSINVQYFVMCCAKHSMFFISCQKIGRVLTVALDVEQMYSHKWLHTIIMQRTNPHTLTHYNIQTAFGKSVWSHFAYECYSHVYDLCNKQAQLAVCGVFLPFDCIVPFVDMALKIVMLSPCTADLLPSTSWTTIG